MSEAVLTVPPIAAISLPATTGKKVWTYEDYLASRSTGGLTKAQTI
jgi:hypothetical protein